jgi:hypothetical protein
MMWTFNLGIAEYILAGAIILVCFVTFLTVVFALVGEIKRRLEIFANEKRQKLEISAAIKQARIYGWLK